MAKLVTCAVIAREGKVLLARRAPGRGEAGKWEFPGGKLEPGETARSCLARELWEELGIRGRVGEHVLDSLYQGEGGEIVLSAYEFIWEEGELELRAHDQLAWAPPAALESYDLAPADIPIARRVAARAR